MSAVLYDNAWVSQLRVRLIFYVSMLLGELCFLQNINCDITLKLSRRVQGEPADLIIIETCIVTT